MNSTNFAKCFVLNFAKILDMRKMEKENTGRRYSYRDRLGDWLDGGLVGERKGGVVQSKWVSEWGWVDATA